MTLPESEFCRRVAVESLDAEGNRRDIEAGDAERAALARRFGIVAVNHLSARFELARPQPGLVEARGRMRAEVVQTCVVSLQDFTSAIEEEVDLIFTDQPDAAAGPDAEGEDFEDLEAEPPEPIVDGEIDLGEAIAQQLFLALDPFPRAPGIAFAGYQSGTDPAAPDGDPEGPGIPSRNWRK